MSAYSCSDLKERAIIFTADDFGLCHSVNKAVIDLFEGDAIHAAMIMMPCPWANQAVDYAKNNPKANIGIHLTLTSGIRDYKWGSVTREPNTRSLLTAEGYLLESSAEVERYAAEEAVRIEVRNQVLRAMSQGISPTHMDSHDGSLLGLANGRDFLEVAFDICEEFELPFKLPKEIVNQPFIREEMKTVFRQRIASAQTRGIMLIDDLISFPYELEEGESYRTMKNKLMEAIRNVKEGITEVTLHPGLNTPEMQAITPHWRKREFEYQLFKDSEIKELLQREKITITSWKGIRDRQRLRKGNRMKNGESPDTT